MIIKTKKIYVPYLLMIGNGFFEFVIEINLRIDYNHTSYLIMSSLNWGAFAPVYGELMLMNGTKFY